jgi:hypothetical protein
MIRRTEEVEEEEEEDNITALTDRITMSHMTTRVGTLEITTQVEVEAAVSLYLAGEM